MDRTHTENEERLTKRVWRTEEGGRKRRGRPKLRWRESIKRDLAEASSREWEKKIVIDGDD